MTVMRQAQQQAASPELQHKVAQLLAVMLQTVNHVDLKAAEKRVHAAKAKYPHDTPVELSQRLIREKCQRTGMVGVLTSGVGIIPGLGTIAAMTMGAAADIQATFKLQAELVLEIAFVYDYPLTELEKQQLIFVVTGLGSSGNALALKVGAAATEKLTEKVTQEMVVKALPVLGVIASASTNALSTYIIGQRADAYFRLGPEAVGSWSDSLRAVSGVDERKLVSWLGESGSHVVAGASKVGHATGAAISTGAGKAVEGSKKVTQSRLVLAVKTVWVFIWSIILFVLSKVGLIKKNPQP
jgi:hypothetical protein